jgi:hypothetical protein
MNIIPKIAESMQTILNDVANENATKCNFIKRQRKFSGSSFVKTLVFGWLDNPNATLDELTQSAIDLDVDITPQALDQRFTYEASECLKQTMESAVGMLIASEAVNIPILERFNGVYIQDSTVITLPDQLSDVWAGCGGSNNNKNTNASLKLQVRMNMNTGQLDGPHLCSGRTQDKASCFQEQHPPKGSLRIADLGYYSLKVMNEMSQQGVYWLSRIYSQSIVYQTDDKKVDLIKLLETQCDYDSDYSLDMPILLGEQQIPCRLLAVKVPPEIAAERRCKINEEYHRKGKTPGKRVLSLTSWTVLVTNIPFELLSLEEAFILKRIRWQIELLFKLWKSSNSIDEWRSKKPYRILCEIYAKLLIVIIQHWILLFSCWRYPERSLFKAVKVIMKYACTLAIAMRSSIYCLQEVLEIICRCLSKCKLNKRKKAPNTYQLLLLIDNETLN